MRKNLFFLIAMMVLGSCLSYSQPQPTYQDSIILPNGEKSYFNILKDALVETDWPILTISMMQQEFGPADWYMVTYSGGNIALMRELKPGYASFELVASSTEQVPYELYYLYSLRMIKVNVKPGQKIIVSDDKEALDKMAKKLKTIRRSKELAMFLIK